MFQRQTVYEKDVSTSDGIRERCFNVRWYMRKMFQRQMVYEKDVSTSDGI